MKKIVLSIALCLAASLVSAQDFKGYEVKAENAYTNYNVRWATGPEDAKHYTTDRLRKEYLIEKVFAPGEVNWTYTFYDRFLIGGAEPTTTPLKLTSIAPLYVDESKGTSGRTLLDNRELGIINIGGNGIVTVDGKKYELGFQEALYVGKGAKEIIVASKNAAEPAKFYLNSACAHVTYPTKKVTLKEAKNIKAGSLKESNDRVIHQMIIDGVAGVRTCQLQMGITELKEGSVWNTMPAHTHTRRMEAYMYYKVPQGQKILHVMGEPQETRPMWMNNEQAVISPQWSIHCAAGTSNYTFIWGMCGENLVYTDMQVVGIPNLK
ncbi:MULTISPECIES: 5-dehydro-4-deoxy-D-glucuronate isomerase [Segatella]|jgi:4-deoxy-L-threo-5-hexosulose-uronate ketol-isomerase|uniref:4-deoxy-L-threo-5-hexosulose-uronate ketol-isomerase n=2 Tax=Segatella TaxID=2974251 RepID=D8DVQ3_9BACT|nr:MULTISPECIES: 5-dehydro-4-deoxy-D-glucuronate isomerase [Segatella]MBQ3857586.1 5-dehydro-4-deoxy-D-glucuronate isomerase [Prevotella sp.]EFI72510.1 4-deoxy-L-threo-5-hexosulose-uronate ketol-isomerase [Segatella baroniae B14]MEE3414261.1 5-dehydro-4-deoxy-D-glucuronate isomerase [Prevotella sp.]UKK72858.1 5-dehydro-4-deoxy-D-glucuronate isomerase [Segatella bryantii]UKK75979.1 5-dehydro-4-deoxy-D-glucuronate isomerase [Segatella bryantii]